VRSGQRVRGDAVRRRKAGRAEHGFTLIELAIALFVVALVLGSLLVPLGTQIEQRQIAQTEKTIDQLKDALIGYAVANGYLPCPDAATGAGANDGVEDVAANGTCTNDDGNLPWVTLGAGATDAWSNRYRYHVDDSYAARAPATTFGLASGASLRVWTSAARTTALTSSSPNGAVAVVMSHGKNGKGAISALTGTVNAAASSADERENTDGSVNFVSRPPSAADSLAGEFDDVVSWLSRFTLYNRMVTAGRLP
jgi:prepilin-type N-terminal cleavage/methylation domain-containing protein